MTLPLLRRPPHLLLLAIGLAITVGSAAAFVPVQTLSVARAADPSSDIPGIELPGTVSAGRLGGAIYDVVYHFSVDPGFVIVANLAGANGTDFDMYLFDSSATTVLSDTGLLKKSTGPTSTESFSWPSRSGGVYYIDLNGATVVEGDYQLTVQAVPDPTPPFVSMVLWAGHPSTNQLTVPVSLTATDDLSGVAEMAFSADGVTWGAWDAFQLSTEWAFTPGDGPRKVWVKVKNGVGLESAPAVAGITIDTVAPVPTNIDPPPGASVSGLRPRFVVVFNEAMDPATWTDLGLIVQSATGDLVPGVYGYDAARRLGSFVPTNPLAPGTSYVVAIGDVRDVAGNKVAPRGSWPITPLAPTSLNVAVTSTVVTRGGSSAVNLLLIGAPAPALVAILALSPPSTDFVPFEIAQVVDSRASLKVTPAQNTTYRLRYEGAFGVAPAQVDVSVLVRRSIKLVGPTSTQVTKVKVGGHVVLVAAIEAATAGVSVSFRLYRFDPVRRAWVYLGSHGRKSDASGRAAYAWAPLSPGSYYWRANVASTAAFANNVSPVYRWSVSR